MKNICDLYFAICRISFFTKSILVKARSGISQNKMKELANIFALLKSSERRESDYIIFHFPNLLPYNPHTRLHLMCYHRGNHQRQKFHHTPHIPVYRSGTYERQIPHLLHYSPNKPVHHIHHMFLHKYHIQSDSYTRNKPSGEKGKKNQSNNYK